MSVVVSYLVFLSVPVLSVSLPFTVQVAVHVLQQGSLNEYEYLRAIA